MTVRHNIEILTQYKTAYIRQILVSVSEAQWVKLQSTDMLVPISKTAENFVFMNSSHILKFS